MSFKELFDMLVTSKEGMILHLRFSDFFVDELYENTVYI